MTEADDAGAATFSPARGDARLLRALLDEHAEWFCTVTPTTGATKRGGRFDLAPQIVARAETSPLRRADLALEERHGGVFVSFWGARGAELWRVDGWTRADARLTLLVSRGAGRTRARLELVPRATAGVHAEASRRAREERLASFASLVRDELGASGARPAVVERARLSRGRRRGEPGRFARVVLRQGAERVFATGAVVPCADEDAESFLAGALLWFGRERERAAGGRPGATRLWLAAAAKTAQRLAVACALLRDGWREIITVWRTDADEAVGERLARVSVPTVEELFESAPRRPRLPTAAYEPSDVARRIARLAPDAIDVIPARHGETLRFRGLPFARVRRVSTRDHVWFGVEGAPAAQARKLLTPETSDELCSLIEDLRLHRRADADDRRHAFYTARAEAWLEHLLRRDIARLDPGLRLAPVYAQLRVAPLSSGARPVDLLAVRRDGRLVVIELKAAEDAALPFQAADYWRRAEAHRRAGHLAQLFGDDAPIADAPPLLYVVAPTLRYDRSFEFLASLLSPAIEIYRFDINEDWRSGVRVQRREQVN